MGLNVYRALVGLGVDPQRVRRWIQKGFLAPISRAYSASLGVPVIAVTGTNGKTTITRLLESILREAGHRVGMACTDGVMRNGKWVAEGDKAGVLGLSLAMKGGEVDLLVAETARGGILKYGIGFRHCQVAVVTNVYEDHLGNDGVETLDQMAEVKARIVDRVAPDGIAVLNADDPRVAAMAERVPGRAILFSMQRPPPEIRRCVFLEGGRIVRRSAAGEGVLMAAKYVAIARRGLHRYHFANVMAVIAALDGLRPVISIPDEVAVRVITRWLPDAEERPFTFHLIEYAGDHILIVHSKNPESFAADTESVRTLRRELGYETVVGFLTHVGDRTAGFHRRIADLAASACDHLAVVVPEAGFLRGRSPDSFVAALEAGIPPEKRLPSLEGGCAELVAKLRDEHPGKTLYTFFNTRQHRGVKELCRDGKEIRLDLSLPSFGSEKISEVRGPLPYPPPGAPA